MIPPLRPGVGLPHIGQAQEIVHAGVKILRQRGENMDGHVQSTQLIIGIGRLVDVQQLRHVLLRQVPVLPQPPQMVQHENHPFAPLWDKGYSLIYF